jgi:hypothetical protein
MHGFPDAQQMLRFYNERAVCICPLCVAGAAKWLAWGGFGRRNGARGGACAFRSSRGRLILATLAGVSRETVKAARHGRRIRKYSATKLKAVLKLLPTVS